MARKRGIIKWINESRSWWPNHWIGFVNGEKAFSIEGRLGMTDIRDIYNTKFYKPENPNGNFVEDLKCIATDIILGQNIERHEANANRQKAEDERFIKLMKDAEELLARLKNS